MAQQVTSDAYLVGIYKTWYTTEGVENLLFRNDPFLRALKKERIGGKEYAFVVMYSRGAACSSDYVRAVALAANGGRNVEFKVQPGNMFAVFNITLKEKAASLTKQGAYTPALVDKMFAATEGLRKQFAASLYGMGYGEIVQIPAVAAASSTMDLADMSGIVKIDIGTSFYITTSAVPSSALYAGGPHTVTAIDGTIVTFSPVVPAGDWAVGGWMVYDGGRDTGGNPNAPCGLGGWIPRVANRLTATWTTYIGTAFYGVIRSVDVAKLAGQWWYAAAAEDYNVSVVKMIRLLRTAGAVPDCIIINSEDYSVLLDEVKAATSYYQSINTSPDKSSANDFQAGLSNMGFQFYSNWVKLVYETPYCPKGYAYVGDSKAISFKSLSNVEAVVNDGIAGNDPGSQKVDAVNTPDVDTYKLVIEDYITTQPASDSPEGPGERVSLSLFGNFVVSRPAHWGCVRFHP